MHNITKLFDFIFYGLFPKTCVHCDSLLKEGEETLCFKCQFTIISYPFSWGISDKNYITNKFQFRMPLKKAASFFVFENTSAVQSLIHDLKYKGNQNIGKWITDFYLDHDKKTFFEDLDLMIPVPLHPKRYKERGYNQVDVLCQSISGITCVEYGKDAVKRMKYTTSQTKKTREQRLKSMEEVFAIPDKKMILDKNILIVDDVLTTGATVESLGNTLMKNGAKSISILSIAVKM
ncbi:ComF family protein [Flammeovirga sp. EKP202]|uniref:ComF family protein n=1 Tax=Flammeovirga sp. EKP202 TaxID=2770592 RepID=UPI00165EF675|nr:phosphoribosyltransferase family protein [Flammeovirga sp. EKP202]MBD0403368.1 ComF family protein [Flammeovirga sp. EKP202]